MNLINSIPEATNRKPYLLIVVVPGNTAILVTQAAVPGIGRTALRRTPPVTTLANGVESSTVVTATAWKT